MKMPRKDAKASDSDSDSDSYSDSDSESESESDHDDTPTRTWNSDDRKYEIDVDKCGDYYYENDVSPIVTTVISGISPFSWKGLLRLLLLITTFGSILHAANFTRFGTGETFNIRYGPQHGSNNNQHMMQQVGLQQQYPQQHNPRTIGGMNEVQYQRMQQLKNMNRAGNNDMQKSSDFGHGEFTGIAITPEQKSLVKKGGIWAWKPPTNHPTKEVVIDIPLVVLSENEEIANLIIPVLEGYKDVWDDSEQTDNVVFWHIAKAGGSTIKNVLGTCHRFRLATEAGIRKGHHEDTEIAIVRPGDVKGQDPTPFVNVDPTTRDGILRAKAMGLAESGLAECIVTPYFHESNDLFSPMHKGRLFSLFREPVDRAISMFYYLQIAEWETTYNPLLKQMTIAEFAKSDYVEDNWMVRQLTQTIKGKLTEDHLNVAMDIVRRKFIVGLLAQKEASMERFEKFFRWKFRVNPPNQERCRERLLAGGANVNKQKNKEKPEPGSEAYSLLSFRNRLDIKLYRYIEDLFVQQEKFVSKVDNGYRLMDASCSKCVPPSFPVSLWDSEF